MKCVNNLKRNDYKPLINYRMTTFNILIKELKIGLSFILVLALLYLGRDSLVSKLIVHPYFGLFTSFLLLSSAVVYSIYFQNLYKSATNRDTNPMNLSRLVLLPYLMAAFLIYLYFRDIINLPF
jgi:Mg/Co/Ni transporter MgtE